jgi:hypothetical protein
MKAWSLNLLEMSLNIIQKTPTCWNPETWDLLWQMRQFWGFFPE